MQTWRPQPADSAAMADGGDQESSDSRRATTRPVPMPTE